LNHGEFPWWWSSSLRWWCSTTEIKVDLAPPLRGRERAPVVVKMRVGDVFWEKIRRWEDMCLRWKCECTYIVERGRWEDSAGDVISSRQAVPEAIGDDLRSDAVNGDQFRSVVAS
jgi:hypothetical protein